MRHGYVAVAAALSGAALSLVPAGASPAAPPVPKPPPAVTALPVVPPITVLPTIAQTPSVSADGKLVVFAGPPATTDGRTSSVWLLERTTGTTTELTVPAAGVRAGNSVQPVISADGCHVAIITEIPFDQFRDDDTGTRWDVYQLTLPACGGTLGDWDLVSTSTTATTTIAATTPAATANTAAGTAGDDVDPDDAPAVSGSGAVIAYTRRFGPLPPPATPTTATELTTVAVVDLTVPIGGQGRSATVAGTPAAEPDTTFRYHGQRQPSISDSGRYVAFVSDATSSSANPVWADGPTPGGFASSQVGVWDRAATDPTTAVSVVSSPAAAPANGDAGTPSISADGRYVAFTSTATNLVAGAVLPPCTGVAVTLPAAATAGSTATAGDAAAVAGAGAVRAVAGDAATTSTTTSNASTTAVPTIATPNPTPNATPNVTPNPGAATATSVAATAATAPAALPAVTAATRCAAQVYRVDRNDGSVQLVSRKPGAPGSTAIGADAGGSQPVISADGSKVVFVTRATNLFDVQSAAGDDPARGEVVIAAADGSSVARVSTSSDGVSSAPLAQRAPRLSSDARTIVFDTVAAASFQPALSTPAASSTTTSTTTSASTLAAGVHVVVVNRAPNVSMADADLGTVAVGYPGGGWFINVTNLGPTAFVPAKISTSNPNFGIIGGTCTLGVAVPAGGKCEVDIILTPSVAGPVAGTLNITEGGFGAVAVTSKLSGIGGEPVLAADRGGSGFGVVDIGKSATAPTFTITNTGFSPANIAGAVLSGSNPADFKIAATTCLGALDIGQTCTVDVAFTPKTGGQRSAIVTVATDAGQTTTMLVGGEGRYTATMSTSSDRLFSGATFGIGGNGFPASSTITVSFADGLGGTYTVTSNKQGAFLTSFALAADERQGRRTMIARAAGGASAAVEVIVVGGVAQGAGPASAAWPAG